MNMFTLLLGSFSSYLIISMIVVWFLRRKDMKEPLPELLPQDEGYMKIVANGKSDAQLVSYIFTWILTLIAGFTLLTLALSTVPGNESMGWGLLIGFLAFGVMGPLTVLGQAFWLYPKRVRKAEAYALRTRRASRLLKAQRLHAWVIQIVYLALIVTQIFYTTAVNS
jgi:hypothetical protein